MSEVKKRTLDLYITGSSSTLLIYFLTYNFYESYHEPSLIHRFFTNEGREEGN